MDAEMLLELDAFILEATLLSPEAYVSDPPTVNVHAGVGLSAPPKKPFRKRLPAAERAERRRKQHRELVARGRAKAREFVEELRTQEMALQEKLDALIESYASGQRRPTPTPTAASTGFDIAAIEKTMRGRLIEAVATADSLSWENQRLEEMLDERLKFQQTVLQAGDAMVAESQTMASCELPQENRLLHRRGYWMYFADDDVPFYFEPYAEAKIEEFAAHALNNAKKLHETFEKRKVPGTRCFGWNMQHIYDHNSMTKLRFRFSKQISTSSSAALRQDLVQKSWTIINTPEQYAKMFSEKIVERLLQRVNDHTSFIVRNNPTKLHSRSLRSFSIMRAYTDVDSQGRMRTYIVLQALEPQDTEAVTLQAAKGVTYISTDFSFMSFTELDDRTLEVVHGGTGGVGDVVQEQFAPYRLVEIGLSWLLWENMVMPQHLIEAE